MKLKSQIQSKGWLWEPCSTQERIHLVYPSTHSPTVTQRSDLLTWWNSISCCSLCNFTRFFSSVFYCIYYPSSFLLLRAINGAAETPPPAGDWSHQRLPLNLFTWNLKLPIIIWKTQSPRYTHRQSPRTHFYSLCAQSMNYPSDFRSRSKLNYSVSSDLFFFLVVKLKLLRLSILEAAAVGLSPTAHHLSDSNCLSTVWND